jgi:hypothetical protein
MIADYSLERADGFQGPIIISAPGNPYEEQLAAKYYAEETIFLQDWYHQDGDTRHAGLDSVPFIWIGYAQSFLINGGGIFAPCLKVGEDSIYDSTNPVWKPTACAADCAVIEELYKNHHCRAWKDLPATHYWCTGIDWCEFCHPKPQHDRGRGRWHNS